MLDVGVCVPNFEAPTMLGTTIELYDYLDKSWGIIISHPSDFDPVCTTELSRLVQINRDLMKRGVKVIIISTRRDAATHDEWIADVCKFSNCFVPFPLINDIDGKIIEQLGMLDKSQVLKTATRTTMVITPDKKIHSIISYPAKVGRNFFELLRLLDAAKLTIEHPGLVTPADWRPGEDVMIEPGKQVEGSKLYELPSGKEYMRYVNDPRQTKK